MKKGFTLAETLVTLVVIGVVAAVTIPILNHARPDKDALMYKKAVLTTQQVMLALSEDPEIDDRIWCENDKIVSYNKFDDLMGNIGTFKSNTGTCSKPSFSVNAFCNYFAGKLDVQKKQGASYDKLCGNGDNAIFNTIDGLQYFFIDGSDKINVCVAYLDDKKNANSKCKDYKLDSSSNGCNRINDRDYFSIKIMKLTGKVYAGGNYEQCLLEYSDGLKRRN